MRRPRIGIPLCLDDQGRWRPGHRYHYIDRSYADAITRAGGLALQLPIQDDPAALVMQIDGLLLPGGDDLPPDPRRDPALPDALRLDLVPEEQLRFDSALTRAAIQANRPVLGICYGMQLLARLRGGRLDIDLESQHPEAGNHQLTSIELRHPIEIEPDSRLARILGTTACHVNSLHHQAVREVGAEHRVVARSPDTVIEAIEGTAGDDRFELGVQWHPEKLDAPESHQLFRHFVAACRRADGGPQDG
jgi:putative glutamine amidotransferase